MKEEWFFTFGFGHYAGNVSLKNRYVRLEGSFDETRKQIYGVCGPRWAMQYPIDELDGQVERFGLIEIPLAEAKL